MCYHLRSAVFHCYDPSQLGGIYYSELDNVFLFIPTVFSYLLLHGCGDCSVVLSWLLSLV